MLPFVLRRTISGPRLPEYNEHTRHRSRLEAAASAREKLVAGRALRIVPSCPQAQATRAAFSRCL